MFTFYFILIAKHSKCFASYKTLGVLIYKHGSILNFTLINDYNVINVIFHARVVFLLNILGLLSAGDKPSLKEVQIAYFFLIPTNKF